MSAAAEAGARRMVFSFQYHHGRLTLALIESITNIPQLVMDYIPTRLPSDSNQSRCTPPVGHFLFHQSARSDRPLENIKQDTSQHWQPLALGCTVHVTGICLTLTDPEMLLLTCFSMGRAVLRASTPLRIRLQ